MSEYVVLFKPQRLDVWAEKGGGTFVSIRKSYIGLLPLYGTGARDLGGPPVTEYALCSSLTPYPGKTRLERLSLQ